MKWLSNRRVACAVLVIAVLGSVFGFGGTELSKQRAEVERVFNDGVDTSFGAHQLSMDAYLDHSADYAGIMVREYRLNSAEDTDSVRQVEQLASVIGNGADYDARYTAYVAFLENVEALNIDFSRLKLDEDATQTFHRAYTDIIEDEADKLRRDGYHEIAAEYNRTLRGFPANLIGNVTGVRTMNTFDGEASR